MHHGIGHVVGHPPWERSGREPLPGRDQVEYPSLDIRPGYPLLVTSGGDHWRPVQMCSFVDPPPVVTSDSGQ